MIQSPFQPPRAGLESSTPTPSSLWQPFAFAVVPLIASVGLIVRFATTRLLIEFPWRGVLDPDFLQIAGGLLVNAWPFAVVILLFVWYQQERHGITRFLPIGRLVLAFSILGTLGVVAVVSTFPLLNARLMLGFDLNPSEQALLMLVWLGALWLVLRFARARAQRQEPGILPIVESWKVALGLALCCSVGCTRLFSCLSLAPLTYYREALYILGGGTGFAVVFMAAWTLLPNRLPRLAVGRLLLTSFIVLLLWASVVVMIRVGLDHWPAPSDALFWPAFVLWQMMLWPLTRWSLRWCYLRDVHER